MKVIMIEKDKWKPLELCQPGKGVNQNQYWIPGGSAEISATIKDMKHTGVVPTIFSFNSLLYLCSR